MNRHRLRSSAKGHVCRRIAYEAKHEHEEEDCG